MNPQDSHRRGPLAPPGGKRPGAGAPTGNLNAFKHGRYSKGTHKIVAALLSDPELRPIVLAIARQQAPARARKRVLVLKPPQQP